MFKVSKSGKETVLYKVTGGDEILPRGGLTMDAKGDLYGTTFGGGLEGGTVYELNRKGMLTRLQYKRKVRRFDAVSRRRLCEMAASHVRYDYRRLTVLLRREDWKVNAKRINRLYSQEQLIVRTSNDEKWLAVSVEP
jgi:uncharacterized repeat protein (TIGR03803 family)